MIQARLAAAILLVTVTGAPTFGADAAPKGAAADLARLIVTRDSYTVAMTQLARNAQQQLQGHPGSKLELPPDFQSKALAEVEAVLPYDDLISIHVKELSASFTEQELDKLVAFYRGPVGEKWLRVSPVASEKVAAETQRRFQRRFPEVMQRLSKLAKAPEMPGKSSGSHP